MLATIRTALAPRATATAAAAAASRRFYAAGVTKVSAQEFDQTLKSTKVPVLVDFFATWCGPCKMLTPKLEALATKNGEALKVIKIDTDEAPEVAQKHGITALPTVVLYKDGKELGRFMGVRNEAQMQQFLDQYKQ